MCTAAVTGLDSMAYPITSGSGIVIDCGGRASAGKPGRRRCCGCCGFTYLTVLIMVVVSGIAISAAGRTWSTMAKREVEKSLLYRGDRIRLALESYYNASPGGAKVLPRRLEDLVRDPRFGSVKRHIRRIYRNPLSGDGNWTLVMASGGRIRGVYAKSGRRPLKTSGFEKGDEPFEKAKTYSDWRFLFRQKGAP